MGYEDIGEAVLLRHHEPAMPSPTSSLLGPPPASGELRSNPRPLLRKAFGLLLASAACGCGPTDLAENVEQAGPIGGPFAVSRFFTASGFMGDGMESGYLTADVDESCKARPPGARGNCYRFNYVPGDLKWAGVFWQHPANNWGSVPGRSIATTFERARFYIAAEYDIVLPAGSGVGASCSDSASCRPGLECSSGRCEPAGSLEAGDHCLMSAECADGLHCLGQRCVEAGTAKAGDGCGVGADELCESGLRCGVAEDNSFRCLPDGAGDVGSFCTTRNECRAGLYCRDEVCQPKTRLGPLAFQVGGISPTKAGLDYRDEIGVSYFARGDMPQPVVSPDWQQFQIDLTRAGEFSSLIGAFMWATPFPDIDELSVSGAQPYLADTSRPVRIYVDDLVFE